MTSAAKHKRRSQYSYSNTRSILGHFDHTAKRKHVSKQIAKVESQTSLLERIGRFFGLKIPGGDKQ
jgi:hypothetical protein